MGQRRPNGVEETNDNNKTAARRRRHSVRSVIVEKDVIAKKGNDER